MFTPPDLMYIEGRFQDLEGRTFPLTDLLNDGAGNLWIGTWGYGAATAGAVNNIVEPLPYGLLQSSVTAIYDDGFDLWLGGHISFATRTGLTAFDPVENSFRYIESGLSHDFPRVDINCISGDSSSLFLGTDYGV